MADLSINPVNTASAPVAVTNSAPAKVASAATSAAAQAPDKGLSAAHKATENTKKAIENAQKDSDRRAELRAREETATKEYGPVVARSGDGDTVRVKAENEQVTASEQSKIYDNIAAKAPETAEAPKPEIQDFEIPKPEVQAPKTEIQMPEPEAQKPEIAQTEAPKPEYVPFEFPDEIKSQSAEAAASADEGSVAATNEKAAQTASVNNASEAELKRMYLQGDISQVQYNSEVENRQEQEDALKAENNQFSAEMTADAAKVTATEREAEAIKELGSDDSSESIPIEVRAQFVQNMDFS